MDSRLPKTDARSGLGAPNSRMQTAVHATVSATVALLSALLSLPSLLLYGLHTYIHPETLGHGASPDSLRAAIRRPSSDSSQAPLVPRKRTRSKSSPEFDESNAQLFRLLLVDSHLRTRLYFSEYRASFVSSSSALSSVLISYFFPRDSGIPLLSSLCAALCVSVSLAKLSFERSATNRSEKQLAALFGIVGFLVALLIEFSWSPSIFGFGFHGGGGADGGPVKIAAAVLAGCLAGLMFVPATRAARSLWVGTDQLHWNLGVVSCGLFGRGLLYLSFLVNVFAASLWIDSAAVVVEGAVSPGEFSSFRVRCLAAAAALQLLLLRCNLQMYLNEAVLCWYQRLHASKIPDTDFGRAKIFLHNYYLCLAVLQFFAPPMLALLLLGLRGNLCSESISAGWLGDCSTLLKEILLFLAWWIVFVWVIFMTCTLALLRRGFLFIC